MKSEPLHHVWKYTDTDRLFWREHLETWLPRRLFDAHTHVSEPRFRIEEMTDQKRRQYWVNEVAEPIGADAAAKCHDRVFPGRELSCLVFGHPGPDYDTRAANIRLQEDCVRRGWHMLACIGPDWPPDEVARLLDLPRVVGVKVYYAMIPGQDADSRDSHLEANILDFLPHEQLELLNRRRAWVTLHVPKADRLGHTDNIAQIKEIRRRYPEITLVIAHLGRNYTLGHAEESLPKLADDEGLYFDNSAVLNPEVHRFALETLGPRRILYGTDNPVFYMRGVRQWEGRTYTNRTNYPFHFNQDREPPAVEAKYTLMMYEALLAIKKACQALQLDRPEIEAIFHDNARRLIDLT